MVFMTKRIRPNPFLIRLRQREKVASMKRRLKSAATIMDFVMLNLFQHTAN
jgi:hypothetical protein